MVERATRLALTDNPIVDSSQHNNNEPISGLLTIIPDGEYQHVMSVSYGELHDFQFDDSESASWDLESALEGAHFDHIIIHGKSGGVQSGKSAPMEDHSWATVMETNKGDVVQRGHFISVTPRMPSIYPLQEWEGWVVEVGEDEFIARLTDLTAIRSNSGPDWLQEEEAIIPISELPEDDFKRLHEGSIFRWVIGYERSLSGTKKRVSQIVFRDLPVMTTKDMSMGEEWARKVSQTLGS